MNQAVGQIDDVTQQNAALVEQAAAAAESLQEQAVNLSRAVDVFELEATDDTAATAAAAEDERRAPGSPMRARPAVEDDTPAAPARTAGGRRNG